MIRKNLHKRSRAACPDLKETIPVFSWVMLCRALLSNLGLTPGMPGGSRGEFCGDRLSESSRK